MKPLRPVLFLGLVLILASSCQNKDNYNFETDDPVVYLEYMTNSQDAIGASIVRFSNALNQPDSSYMVQLHEGTLKELTTLRDSIAGAAPFKKDDALKDALLDFASFYTTVIDKDFREVVQLKLNGPLNDSIQQRLQVIATNFIKQENEKTAQLQKAVDDFKAKYLKQ